MRVILVSSESGSRGGGEIFLEYLAKELTGRGHNVIVWIPDAARMNELVAKCARDAKVIRSSYRNTYDYSTRSTCFNWSVSRRIAEEWNALGPDVVHINKQNLKMGCICCGRCGSARCRASVPSISLRRRLSDAWPCHMNSSIAKVIDPGHPG
jgi:hypothetical protein